MTLALFTTGRPFWPCQSSLSVQGCHLHCRATGVPFGTEQRELLVLIRALVRDTRDTVTQGLTQVIAIFDKTWLEST